MDSQGSVNLVSYNICYIVKKAQHLHGYEEGHFTSYSRFCTRKIKKLCKMTGIQQFTAFHKVKACPEERFETPKYAEILIFHVERCLANYSKLKESYTECGKGVLYHRMVSKLRKSKQYVSKLENFVMNYSNRESKFCFDKNTQLEVLAYKMMIYGYYFLAVKNFLNSLCLVYKSRKIYSYLSEKVFDKEIKGYYSKLMEDQEMHERMCCYNLDQNMLNDIELDSYEVEELKNEFNNDLINLANISSLSNSLGNIQLNKINEVIILFEDGKTMSIKDCPNDIVVFFEKLASFFVLNKTITEFTKTITDNDIDLNFACNDIIHKNLITGKLYEFKSLKIFDDNKIAPVFDNVYDDIHALNVKCKSGKFLSSESVNSKGFVGAQFVDYLDYLSYKFKVSRAYFTVFRLNMKIISILMNQKGCKLDKFVHDFSYNTCNNWWLLNNPNCNPDNFIHYYNIIIFNLEKMLELPLIKAVQGALLTRLQILLSFYTILRSLYKSFLLEKENQFKLALEYSKVALFDANNHFALIKDCNNLKECEDLNHEKIKILGDVLKKRIVLLSCSLESDSGSLNFPRKYESIKKEVRDNFDLAGYTSSEDTSTMCNFEPLFVKPIFYDIAGRYVTFDNVQLSSSKKTSSEATTTTTSKETETTYKTDDNTASDTTNKMESHVTFEVKQKDTTPSNNDNVMEPKATTGFAGMIKNWIWGSSK